MKETLARIAAWAKANPVLAVLILGGVILLGYLAYKSGAGGSGGGSDQVSVPAPTEAGLLGGGGGSTTAPGNPPPTTTTTKKKRTTTTTTGGSGGAGGRGIPEFGQGSSGFMTGFPGLTATQLDGQFSNFQLPISNLQMGHKTVAMVGTEANYNSSPGSHVSRRGGGGGSTPAMDVGKGRHFTGYYNGTYYSNGYPAGSLNIPGVQQSGDYYYSTTGDRPAVASGKVRY